MLVLGAWGDWGVGAPGPCGLVGRDWLASGQGGSPQSPGGSELATVEDEQDLVDVLAGELESLISLGLVAWVALRVGRVGGAEGWARRARRPTRREVWRAPAVRPI